MPHEQEPERLQKLLSRLGVASRREAEQWIRAGRLSINGRAAALGDRVDAGDQLQLDRGSTVRVIRIDAAGGSGSNQWYQIETIGASGNDLRQLLERQGVAVSRLMRVRLGSVQLERSMPRGRWRELLPAEIEALLKPPGAASSAADNPDSAR